MLTKSVKIALPIFFMGMLSQAISSNFDLREFDIDKIRVIKLKVDNSKITFDTSHNHKFVVNRQIINSNPNAHLSIELENNILCINSTNSYLNNINQNNNQNSGSILIHSHNSTTRSFDGNTNSNNNVTNININSSISNSYNNFGNKSFEEVKVNYIITLPKAVDIDLYGGHIEIKSNCSFNSLDLSAGTIKGEINNPDCDVRINTGCEEIDFLYNKIPATPLSINVSTGMGTSNLRLPNKATVNCDVSASSFTCCTNSDFMHTAHNPNFNVKFSIGGGALNILQLPKDL